MIKLTSGNINFATGSMKQKVFLFLLGCCNVFSAMSQERTDSTGKILDEVVVTATRTENKISNVPLPMQVIGAQSINLSGSQKLIDILEMQSGLVIANNPLGTSLQGYPNPFGSGIQLQGLDPAYTLILLDGEPLTGRNAGIINLGRIAVGNIKQIEILKGPATSLYGSDALAGVINIISETPKNNYLDARLHYGTNNTLGITASTGIIKGNTVFEIFANRYSSDGYDLDKNIYGKTIDPYTDYSFSGKMISEWNDKNKLTLSGRFFTEKQFNNYMIYPDDQPSVVSGTSVETDESGFLKWNHKVNGKVNYHASVYVTGYSNDANAYLQKNDSLYENISLDQLLVRPELQFNIGAPKALFISGVGYNFEKINSSRYSSKKDMDSWYAFVQKQWQWKENFNIIAGARFDKNSIYNAQLSPKLALAYKINPSFILKGSIGAGFKAPDFRQQFLNFSNSLIGYTILGAKELGEGLIDLQNSGQLDKSVNITPYLNGVTLTPEKSIGINVGADYTFGNKAVWKLNLFRNDISNLIESYNLPFSKSNNQSIFSYKNLNKVFTEGIETNFSYKLDNHFSVFGGYQFLIAKDKDVIKEIKAGKLYKRDPETNVTTLVRIEEYKGLFNRSKHTANARIQYRNDNKGVTAFLAAKYRGRYGFSGLDDFQDGNEILDNEKEFVKGFVLMNATLSKQLGRHFELQGGVQNMLNYTNKTLMPNIYGRSYFINVNFKLEK